MRPEQKRAWLAIVMFAVTLIVFLILLPFIGAKAAWGAFGLFGLVGLGPAVFRDKPDEAGVTEDERDKAILHMATMVGGMTSYVAFVAACMSAWFIYMWNGWEEIGINYLPFVTVCGLVTLFVARAVMILVLYERGGPRERN